MAQLRFIGGAPESVPGVGRVHPGVIHTVPDELVSELLGGGDWVRLERERVTEPAPVAPAVKPGVEKSKPKKSKPRKG